MDKEIVLKPRLSEKTYAQSATRVYIFDVAGNVNKHSVAKAVETQFEVQVMKVNITNIPGKAKRTVAKKGRLVARGHESDLKKAYVTLVEGQSLPFFAAAEEAEAKEAKQAEKTVKKEKK
jgi:large subunit ribosomal protein L23